MAIQISEKHLSPEAARALNNANNKSQFLRDAIEFYVKKDDTELKNDIKQIKQLLSDMNVLNIESAVTEDNNKVSKEEQLISNNEPIQESKEHLKQEDKAFINPEIVKDITDPIKLSNNVKTNDIDSLSEEEKKNIEKMLDNSLDNF